MSEILQGLFGDKALTYTEFSAKLEENKAIKLVNLSDGGYVGKEKFDALKTERDGLFGSLNEANKKLEGYDPNWKTIADSANQKITDEVSKVKFDYALSDALRAGKVRDLVAVKAHLKSDNLKLDGDKIIGLDDQLKSLKESHNFLFEQDSPPPYSTGTPGFKHNTDETAKDKANAALRAVFGTTRKD